MIQQPKNKNWIIAEYRNEIVLLRWYLNNWVDMEGRAYNETEVTNTISCPQKLDDFDILTCSINNILKVNNRELALQRVKLLYEELSKIK